MCAPRGWAKWEWTIATDCVHDCGKGVSAERRKLIRFTLVAMSERGRTTEVLKEATKVAELQHNTKKRGGTIPPANIELFLVLAWDVLSARPGSNVTGLLVD